MFSYHACFKSSLFLHWHNEESDNAYFKHDYQTALTLVSQKKQGFLSLEIPCCQEKDTGNYMCEVRNDHGKIFTSCYLQVERE